MKKYLFSALALPLLFACSSEDFDEKVISNDQFAGIEKVNATFTMDEGPITRMDKGTGWTLANGDLYGFAWLTDAHTNTTDPYTPLITIDGKAYQNHNLIQTSGIFKPQTSIYVGKYYIYRPYDETTVSPQAINFNSLVEQPLAEGYASGYGTTVVTPWKKLAESAIVIADKWTEILPAGRTYGTDPTVWDKPGIAQPYKVFAANFSNETGLDLKYVKNNPSFAAAKTITGATDINLTYAAGESVGSADIYDATVQLSDAPKSFTYAPTTEPNAGDHSGSFWASKKISDVGGLTGTAGAITLTADTEKGISTGDNGSKGWFWFNSLPATTVVDAAGLSTTKVTTVLNTSYGVVTVDPYLADCAQVFDKYNAAATNNEWIKLASADKNTTTPKEWNIAGHNTFINQLGNHIGKYAFTVDFSTGVMDGMHIKDDRHLQKLLKFYLASGKTEDATLLLDKDADNEFKISKISIALLQTINATTTKVTVKACDGDATHTPDKIVVTQDGQTGDLANKTEVPDLNNVFAVATDVYLAAKNSDGTDITWTWKERTAPNQLTIDANVSKLINEGTLTVNATNVQLSEADVKIFNAKDATMNITKVTTVKNTLHNYGTLNVGSASNTTAELRAYGPKWIVNNATSLTEHGVINNYGVVGVTAGTSGQFNNYGLINMMNDDAITLLTSNEKGTTPFKNTFDASTNKMGTVVLPTGNPYAIVSVSNAAENGFIKYNWTAATYAHDPGNVKYNTIVVSNDIEFTGDAATEIQYIEFDGTNRALVVNPAAASKLTNLKGIIVKDNSSIVIEKTNEINCAVGAFLGKDATVYKGGAFTVADAAFATPTNTTMYLGTWSLDQIVEY